MFSNIWLHLFLFVFLLVFRTPGMPQSQNRRIRMPTGGGLCASMFLVQDPFEQLQSFMAHDRGL